MKPKVLLVILVLLVVLFAAAIVVGAAGGSDHRSSAQALAQATGRWLLSALERVGVGKSGAQHLSVRDLEEAPAQACQDLLVVGALQLGPGESCAYRVAPSSAPMRTLPLSLAQGIRLRVSVTLAMDNDWHADQDLDRGTCKTFQFLEGGGEIDLVCQGAASDLPCRVEVPADGCPR